MVPGAASIQVKLRPKYTQLLGYFLAFGGLLRNHAVLDVGCGRGKMAHELATFLGSDGRYDGFDIRLDMVEDLRRRISDRFPNFRFHHANIYSKHYNPLGTSTPGDYVFPFEDERFDFVFLLSVFTHLIAPDMEHYLTEVSRVMKVGGRCAITYFLLNDEALRLMDAGISVKKTFKHTLGHYRLRDAEVPESAVAVDETFVRAMYERHGMRIVEPIHYGRWCGRRGPEIRQDVVFAIKEPR